LKDQLSAKSPQRDQTTGVLASVIILVAIVSTLVVYKSGAALRALQNAAATGSFVAAGDLLHAGQSSVILGVVARTGSYLAIIWPALVFGILVAGAVRAFVSPAWVARVFDAHPLRQQLAAGVAGAPLMLCSCCVAPIFSAVRERSGRLGPSLAVALAAPSLNPATLALTFVLFRPQIATLRLALALVAVFLVSPLIARVCPTKGAVIERPLARSNRLFAEQLLDFITSSAHIALRTVPVLFVGIVAAMWILSRLPAGVLASIGPGAATTLAAFVAVPVALPTFFEIPLALTLLSIGAPAGVAVAVLFAGPAVNLASLLAIGRSAGWRVAAALALAVAVLACVGGLLVA